MKQRIAAHTAVALAVLLLALAAWPHAAARSADVQADHGAIVVVRFGDGSQIQRRVHFPEDTITGLELLRRSGLGISTWGAAVCQIAGEGCDYPATSCFCQCPGSPCSYWSYWHWREGRWVYSSAGSADHPVTDGDVEGWVWGDGQSAPDPPTAEMLNSSQAGEPPAVEAGGAAASSLPAPSPGPGRSLSPYVALAIMLAALIGGFAVLQGRREE